MRTILLLILLTISNSILSQQFNWGYPFRIEDETGAKINYHYDHEGLIRLYSKYDLGIFNYQINNLIFSPKEFEKTSALAFGVEKPKVLSNLLTHVDLFETKGVDYTFFLNEIERGTKKNVLHWQPVSIKTGDRGDLKLITSMTGKSISNSGNYHITQSENKSFFAVLKEFPFYKKKNEIIEIVLLDANKNIIKQYTHTFSIIDKRNKSNKIFVSNSGKVYIVKEVKLPKQKPYKIMYRWDPETDELKEYSLQLDKDYQIHQFDIDFDNENNLYFNGLVTYEGSKSIQLKIGLDGRPSGVTATGIFSLKISDEGEIAYKVSSEFEKIKPNLHIKDFVIKDQRILFFMDKMIVVKETVGSPLDKNFTYNYTFNNTGMFIGALNNTDGKLNWSKDIVYEEPQTKNDNGEFLSYLYLFNNSKVVLLYNDTRDINKGIVHVPYYKKFPVKEVYDLDGNLTSKEDLITAGVGVIKEEKFDLDTSMLHQIDENTYIVRAKSRVEYKYGFMTF